MVMQALAHHCVKDVSLWTTHDLDFILREGDTLYMSTADAHNVTFLLPSEAVKTVIFHGRMINLQVDDTRTGVLSNASVSPEEGTVTLQQALEQIEHTAVLTIRGVFSSYSIGIIKVQRTFYVVDSHSRDERGLCHSDGLACVTEHEGLENLISFHV